MDRPAARRCDYHDAPATRFWWTGPRWVRFKAPAHLDLCEDCAVKRQSLAVAGGSSLFLDSKCLRPVDASVLSVPPTSTPAIAAPSETTSIAEPAAAALQPLDPGVGAGVEGHPPPAPLESIVNDIPPRGRLRARRTCLVPGCGLPHKSRGRCVNCDGRARRKGWLELDPAGDLVRVAAASAGSTTPTPTPTPTPNPPVKRVAGDNDEETSTVPSGGDVHGQPLHSPATMAQRLAAALALRSLERGGHPADPPVAHAWIELANTLEEVAHGRRGWLW